jgi:ADP-ribosylglycohydrolase
VIRSEIPCRERILGCLLGGAVGDALGAPVEFMSWPAIAAHYGPAGLTDFDTAYGRIGAITDDTQMTLFTAEGLILARAAGTADLPEVNLAQLRWLGTQGQEGRLGATAGGWLLDVDGLHARRAPGNTCLVALSAATDLSSPARNNSKGCGGVMRVAPFGLLAASPGHAFRDATAAAAFTHGHITGQLAAGAFAAVIAAVLEGSPLCEAVDLAKALLRQHDGAGETLAAIDAAERLGAPTPAALESLGGGWTGEEALAIALAAVKASQTFGQAALTAVNHSGDSDSTGSIAGQLAGALLGAAAIPERWLERLEHRDVVERIAHELAALPIDRESHASA